jgi:hypothetical protein
MSDQYKGFPCGGIDHLTKREIFAGQIMAAMVGGLMACPHGQSITADEVVALSTKYADMRIKELNK